VSISGFGSFTAVEVKERTIRHPQTGDPVYIPSRFKAKFTSFRALKETINSEKLTS
jgi:nucleoid DNA-binding protein